MLLGALAVEGVSVARACGEAVRRARAAPAPPQNAPRSLTRDFALSAVPRARGRACQAPRWSCCHGACSAPAPVAASCAQADSQAQFGLFGGGAGSVFEANFRAYPVSFIDKVRTSCRACAQRGSQYASLLPYSLTWKTATKAR